MLTFCRKNRDFDSPRVARCTRQNSKVDSRLIPSDRGCLYYSIHKICSGVYCLLNKFPKICDGRTDTGLTDAGFQASPTQNALRAIKRGSDLQMALRKQNMVSRNSGFSMRSTMGGEAYLGTLQTFLKFRPRRTDRYFYI